MADRARPAADQQRLARDVASGKDAMGRGEAGNAERRAGLEAGALGQGHRLCGGQGDIVGPGAMGALPLAVPEPDLFADAGRVDAVAHRLDPARAIGMGDDQRVIGSGHARTAAGAGLGIRGVHPGKGDPHEHFATGRAGLVDLIQREDVPGRAEMGIGYGAHEGAPAFGVGVVQLRLRRRITTSTLAISAPSGASGRRVISSCSAGASERRFSSSQKKCG